MGRSAVMEDAERRHINLVLMVLKCAYNVFLFIVCGFVIVWLGIMGYQFLRCGYFVTHKAHIVFGVGKLWHHIKIIIVIVIIIIAHD